MINNTALLDEDLLNTDNSLPNTHNSSIYSPYAVQKLCDSQTNSVSFPTQSLGFTPTFHEDLLVFEETSLNYSSINHRVQ